MDRLAALRLSAEWERALVACLDHAPPPARTRFRTWAFYFAVLMGSLAGIAIWLFH
jgi:hypothetical protein